MIMNQRYGVGDLTITITPPPMEDPLPNQELVYETSTGFNNFGKPIKYRAASNAECNNAVPTTEGLVFYALSNSGQIIETGQTYDSYGEITYNSEQKIPCYYFNGDSCIITSINPEGTGYTENTISFWIKCISLYDYDNRYFFCSHNTNESYLIFSGARNSFSYYPSHINWNVNVSTNVWYHVCITTKNNERKAYVNGENVDSGNWDYATSLNGMIIGARATDWDGKMYGYISSLRIYNRVLSEDEIKILSKEFKNL